MAELTPMMEQYKRVKEQYKNYIIFFRLGDFYEMFFDDAILASKVLNIALTGRDCGQGERAPMCGVPHHSAQGYIQKLVDNGLKVVICEQVEDAKSTKTLVRRDVVKIVTPGTVTDTSALPPERNNTIAAVVSVGRLFGLAYADITTGMFNVTALETEKALADELARLSPAELVIPEDNNKINVEPTGKFTLSKYGDWNFDLKTAKRALCIQFGVTDLNGFGIADHDVCIMAAGGLLAYLTEMNKGRVDNITGIKRAGNRDFLELDTTALRNLEILETIWGGKREGSLLHVIDMTETPMGARLLRSWLTRPLLDVDTIDARLDAVEELTRETVLRSDLRHLLNSVSDIERQLAKVTFGNANARDVLALKNSIAVMPAVKLVSAGLMSALGREAHEHIDGLADVKSLITIAIMDEPSANLREGGYIKAGYSKELDEYRSIKADGTTWLLELEQREREKTGIRNLKFKFNKVFGYFIEVSNANLANVPDYYQRKQTVATGERFTTIELKELERKILSADEQITEIEMRLFGELLNRLKAESARIRRTAEAVAKLDVLAGLAEVAIQNNYCRPVVDNSEVISIIGGRHPVLERLNAHSFIPNDANLDRTTNRLMILTGPNMGGKSTYMRQTADIVILAQMGSFVPADSARIGVVDRIFTRIGAHDDLSTGRSTFMVEMSEVANILNNATPKSLLILDEIGRGTSTYDGLAIAWAVLEHIVKPTPIGARTMFATHYHELTALEGHVDGVVNYSVTVAEDGHEIVFLYKIKRGGADKSYGIHVAQIAGLPSAVTARSFELLGDLNG